MDSDFATALGRTELFRKDPAWQSVLSMWTEVTLDAGEVLWQQHAPATELGLVLDGEIAIHIGDEEVGTIGAGELVGESCAFVRGEVRTGTVVAISGARIATLGWAQLAALRGSHTPVYDLLLDRALKESAAQGGHTPRAYAADRREVLIRADRLPVSPHPPPRVRPRRPSHPGTRHPP